MPASTFKSPPFIILSETKEHHPQAGDCNLNNITLYCGCLLEGGAAQAGGPALTCKVFMSDFTEPGICLQPSKIVKQGLLNGPVLFIHNIEAFWQSLSRSLGPCGYHYTSHRVFWLVLPLAGCWVRLWCQQRVYLFCPRGETRLSRLNQNSAQSLQVIIQRQLWQALGAWNIDTARGKVFVASCWMSSSCSWMFPMKYEKIVERFHKSKITYNLCLHLWFVFALPVSVAVAIVISY